MMEKSPGRNEDEDEPKPGGEVVSWVYQELF